MLYYAVVYQQGAARVILQDDREPGRAVFGPRRVRAAPAAGGGRPPRARGEREDPDANPQALGGETMKPITIRLWIPDETPTAAIDGNRLDVSTLSDYLLTLDQRYTSVQQITNEEFRKIADADPPRPPSRAVHKPWRARPVYTPLVSAALAAATAAALITIPDRAMLARVIRHARKRAALMSYHKDGLATRAAVIRENGASHVLLLERAKAPRLEALEAK